METIDVGHEEQMCQSNDSTRLQRRAERSRLIQERYDAGQPLFTKTQLASLAEQIAHKSHLIQIKGMDGEMTYQPVAWDDFDDRETLSIEYKPIQRLVISSNCPVEPFMPSCSVNVGYTTLPPQKTPDQVSLTVDKMIEVFEKYRDTWWGSPEFIRFQHILTCTPMPDGINKVICFGLGDLSLDSGDDHHHRCRGHSEARCHIQHAVALFVAQILEKRFSREIPVYCQDPEYTQASIELLHCAMVEEVLNDPQGFLDVDENTVVISIDPSIPVKQIITDLARPAMIIWNDQFPVEMDTMDWRYMRLPDGSGRWISPWMANPDSARTRKMEKDEYRSCPFPNDKVAMRNTRILVKKASNGEDELAPCLHSSAQPS
ncbi:hypothetical protein LX32DRAFT_342620 [Colletotrichum zoysiae]|uniref:SRR1-like domain-containing protein n=1 Tax=Colletotrichum zoysiae TaxID=1216348 RepID=A0AAD9HIV6_9PEZI|nr:hypothetical protein LX32DRAFT_342620 [Colletotrichum zoysiae]